MTPAANIIPLRTAGTSVSLAERSDDDLLLIVRGGRADAFDVLVRRHQDRGLRIAHKYLGDANVAKDAVQGAFIEIYRALPRYQPRGQFLAYFHRVLLNQCHMAHRSRRSAARLANDSALDLAASVPRSDDLIIARERSAAVAHAARRLSRKLREVLVLRFAGDLSYEEIATVLAVPVGTIKSRLAAGVERLRELIDREVLR